MRIAALQPLMGQPLKPGQWRFPIGNLVGIFIAEFGETKDAACRNLKRAAQCGRMGMEYSGHIRMTFEATFGIQERLRADRVDRDLLAHAGQHIGELLAAGAVHQHITQRHHRGRALLRKSGAGAKPGLIRAVIARCGAKEDIAGETTADLLDLRHHLLQLALRQRDQDHALAVRQEIPQFQITFAFLCPALAKRQKPGKALIGSPILRQGQPVYGTFAQDQPTAHDQLRQVGRHWPGERDGVPDLLARGTVDPVLRGDADRLTGLLLHVFQRPIGPDKPRQANCDR